MKRILLTILLAFAAASFSLTRAAADGLSPDAKPAEAGIVRVLPAGLEFSVSSSSDTAVRFEVFGITGQLVTAVTLEPDSKQTIDMRKGCYIVRSIHDGKSSSKRFTVQ